MMAKISSWLQLMHSILSYIIDICNIIIVYKYCECIRSVNNGISHIPVHASLTEIKSHTDGSRAKLLAVYSLCQVLDSVLGIKSQ